MLAFLIVLLVAAAIFQLYTLRRGFDGVSYSCAPARDSVEPGEAFEVVTVLKNGSRRFLPFIGLQEAIPAEAEMITPGIETQTLSRGNRVMSERVYLTPRQTLTRRVTVKLPRRGRYFFRGATLTLGDFLGLQEIQQSYSALSEIVVLPARYPIDPDFAALGGFLGDVSVRRFILEDPVLTLGFREYTMREPLKAISWTQTAKAGRLMVKNYDHTLEPSLTVALNVACPVSDAWEDHIEASFSLARTVCEALEKTGVQYDFVTNATASGALSLWDSLGEGLGRRHLMTILEGLGRATYAPTEPCAALLDRLCRRGQQGRATLLITPESLTPGESEGVRRLEGLTGGAVTVITAEEGAPWR
jgi:uncharacterized protein (DUF58 family)